MGGLITRHLHQQNPTLINKIVSINTPWKGTKFQHIALGKQAKQMAENTLYTASDDLPATDHLAIISDLDWIVLPPINLTLPGLNMVNIKNSGHMECTLFTYRFPTYL